MTARRAAKRRAARTEDVAQDLSLASQLALALRLFGDAGVAGQYVGIPPGDVVRIRAIVDAHAKELRDGGTEPINRSLEVAVGLLAESAIRQRDQIAPRDAAHVAKALARARALLAAQKQVSYATVHVTLGPARGGPEATPTRPA